MRLENDENYLNLIFDLIVKRAFVGERAPINTEIRGGQAVLQALANQGRIKVEVYAHNWRVIEILKGPSVGARTKESPIKAPPYIVY